MDLDACLASMDEVRTEHLRRIDALRDEAGLCYDQAEVARRLRLALRQELEAAEIAALWMPTTREVDVKLALGRMVGDEVRHYELLLRRLQQLGETVTPQDSLAGGTSRFYAFLAGIDDVIERVAAACYTREAIGHLRNEQFIAFCERAGDHETARMYREQIQPDEWGHVEAGARLLRLLIRDAAGAERAQAISRRTLELAEGAVSQLVLAQGLSCAPGC